MADFGVQKLTSGYLVQVQTSPAVAPEVYGVGNMAELRGVIDMLLERMEDEDRTKARGNNRADGGADDSNRVVRFTGRSDEVPGSPEEA